jgi:hypothetical protein
MTFNTILVLGWGKLGRWSVHCSTKRVSRWSVLRAAKEQTCHLKPLLFDYGSYAATGRVE